MINPRTASTHRQTGFTLVELMVALTLGLLVTAAIVSLFIQTKTSSRQNDNISLMQENARFALDVLRRDLMHADFFGGIVDPGADIKVSATGPTPDCGAGWAYSLTAATDRLNYAFNVATATDAADAYPCIGSTFRPNTNILAVKRVKGAPITTLVTNRVYLRSNNSLGTIYHYKTSDDIPAAITGSEVKDWEYQAHIYHITPDSALVREYLEPGATPAMSEETLAEGIEYFHVEFGIDTTTGIPDGVADFYTADPGTNLGYAVSARIYVLARSPYLQNGYSNTKIYTMGSVNVNQQLLGGAGATFNDGFYRRVYTTTVALKNIRNQLLLGN